MAPIPKEIIPPDAAKIVAKAVCPPARAQYVLCREKSREIAVASAVAAVQATVIITTITITMIMIMIVITAVVISCCSSSAR
jgi:hypothetical protein